MKKYNDKKQTNKNLHKMPPGP